MARSYRGVDKCTDVLSVPHEYFMRDHDDHHGVSSSSSSSSKDANTPNNPNTDSAGNTPDELGDIIICPFYVQRYCDLRYVSSPKALRNVGVARDASHVTGHVRHLCDGLSPSALQLRLDRLLLHGVCHLVGGLHDDEQQHKQMLEVSSCVSRLMLQLNDCVAVTTGCYLMLLLLLLLLLLLFL